MGANIGFLNIYNNTIHSSLPTTDINLGTLISSGNLVINRQSVFNKDIDLFGNLYATGNVTVLNNFYGNITCGSVTTAPSGIRNLVGSIWANVDLVTDSIVFVYNPPNSVTINPINFRTGDEAEVIISMATRQNINIVLPVQNLTTGANISLSSLKSPQTVICKLLCVDGTHGNTIAKISYV